MIQRYLSSIAWASMMIAAAEAQEAPKTIEFGNHTWEVAAEKAELIEHMGKAALALKKGRLIADDADFSNGVISFKAAYPEHRAFIGASWRVQGRAQDQLHAEEMYFRAHLNQTPDSIQYTPVNNGMAAWQIYSDGNAIAPISQDYDGWNDVKIVVQDDRADIYFNSDDPVLHVPDLKNDLPAGGITLRSSNRADVATIFADLVIRPLEPGEGVIGTPKDPKPLPEGLINTWSVSSPFDESVLTDRTQLPDELKLVWQKLDVESNGIANLARLAGPSDGADTVLIRKTITVSENQIASFQFGFSDRVRLYLNGDLIYAGNDGFRTRDYRFLGLVGFYDTVGLNLKEGDNELVAAVSETFGGWGWAGALKLE